MIWLGLLVTTVLGVAFAGFGVTRLVTGRSWPVTQGTVVSHERDEDNWYPVVEFAAAGRTVRAADNVGTTIRRYRVGRRVRMRYDPTGALAVAAAIAGGSHQN